MFPWHVVFIPNFHCYHNKIRHVSQMLDKGLCLHSLENLCYLSKLAECVSLATD